MLIVTCFRVVQTWQAWKVWKVINSFQKSRFIEFQREQHDDEKNLPKQHNTDVQNRSENLQKLRYGPYQVSYIRDTQYKKITEHTMTVIIIILHVVLHTFSMLEYGNPY